jgi:hypothetical protein
VSIEARLRLVSSARSRPSARSDASVARIERQRNPGFFYPSRLPGLPRQSMVALVFETACPTLHAPCLSMNMRVIGERSDTVSSNGYARV